ncbi:ATP-binding protein [Undibacterium sp. Rencai35W]|uniref:ATP-binding protein n=1 Tax=Undibacterium sp. Rencai35W TaxID=3413046 RepID=UPI003BF3CAB3
MYEIPPKNHPIHTQQYAIFTPAINRLIEQIGLWIEQQKTGAYIYGPSRFGKSRAVQYFLREMLIERFGANVPLVILIRKMVHSSPGPFYSDILLASNQPYWNSKKSPIEKQNMALELLIAMAKNAGINYAILLIDEAQTMTLKEWVWLISLQNLFDSSGYRLSVISIGSHQLGYEHKIQALSGNAHVSARFFIDSARFVGLINSEEVRYVLLGYDEDSEWPVDSGISYTSAFANADFSRNRRLSDSAEIIWKIFLEFFPNKFPLKYELPMLHLARAVESVLKRISKGAEWSECTSEESWRDAIRETGISDYLRLISSNLSR